MKLHRSDMLQHLCNRVHAQVIAVFLTCRSYGAEKLNRLFGYKHDTPMAFNARYKNMMVLSSTSHAALVRAGMGLPSRSMKYAA